MIGIIGGSGLSVLKGMTIDSQQWVETPFGETSAPVSLGVYNDVNIAFMPRHGNPHRLAPHLINYRANLYGLREAGVSAIVAVNAVGGIHKNLGPTKLSIPDQIIDYTYGREHTIYDGLHCKEVDHIDFTQPYTDHLRQSLIRAAKHKQIEVLETGVYGATQGPRLETSAEIKRFQSDGCDMVGMTGMPEAALARELGLDYACIALSVNWAAGLDDKAITMDEIYKAVEQGMANVELILSGFLTAHT